MGNGMDWNPGDSSIGSAFKSIDWNPGNSTVGQALAHPQFNPGGPLSANNGKIDSAIQQGQGIQNNAAYSQLSDNMAAQKRRDDELAAQKANTDYLSQQATADSALGAEDAFTKARNEARRAKGNTLFGAYNG